MRKISLLLLSGPLLGSVSYVDLSRGGLLIGYNSKKGPRALKTIDLCTLGKPEQTDKRLDGF